MNSPVEILIRKWIRIDRKKSDPIYLQVVYQFINAIRSHRIMVSSQLPGTRKIAELLSVHRQTVVKAIQELSEQGWITITPNVGMTVASPEMEKSLSLSTPESFPFFTKERKQNHTSFLLDSPFENSDCTYKIDDGQPDFQWIHLPTLSRDYQTAFHRKNVFRQMEDFSNRTNTAFLDAICNYLIITHRFAITRNKITIAESKEMLLYVLSQIIIKSGDVIIIGDLSYYFSNMIFQQMGAKLISIPVDENGLDIDYLQRHFTKGEIKAIFVHSSAHYPTTATLSKERREKLVRLSIDYDFIIIDENENFEFTYESENIPYLFQLAHQGNILFIGGFGRFLPAAFHAYFLIAPPDLILEMERYLKIIDPQSDIVKQQVLSEMISNGSITRYRWKAIQRYEKKRNHWIQLLREAFGNEINCSMPQSGLAVWVEFKTSFSLLKWQKQCEQLEVFLPKLNIYQNQRITAVRLGFGNMDEKEMKTIISLLHQAWMECQ